LGSVAAALRALRWPARLVLCYHAVDDTWHDLSLSVPSGIFRRQMEVLRAAGYEATTFASLATGDVTGGRALAVTFDDAFTSVATNAFPILSEFGWPATVFVPTEPVAQQTFMYWISDDVRGHHPVAAAPLDWSSLADLAAAGWEIGSHSQTHRLLSLLSDDDLRAELEVSREEVAAHVGTCVSISYPWGEVDERVVRAARRAGYQAGAGLAGRFDWTEPLRFPRVTVAGQDGRFAFSVKSSRPFWRLRSLPIWDTLDVVRGLDGPRDVTPVSRLARWRGRSRVE
jgi:peptidoglycan/xylan/chitin deacetylase (PgdA/CDA1 family)